MKIKVVDNPPVDPREFDLRKALMKDILKMLLRSLILPSLDITIGIILTQILASKNYMNLVKN